MDVVHDVESEVAEAMPVLIDLLAEHFQRLSDCFFQSMESGTKYKGTVCAQWIIENNSVSFSLPVSFFTSLYERVPLIRGEGELIRRIGKKITLYLVKYCIVTLFVYISM